MHNSNKPQTKKRKAMLIWTGVGLVILIGAALWGPLASHVPQPKYTVAEKYGAIEIRDYSPMVVAEVETTGARDPAIREGFILLANYIFGGNKTTQKIAMTAPVSQQKNEKIAMTAPVLQENSGPSQWKIRFAMPENFTLESLPKPNNPAVILKEVASKRFAVIRFSGFITEATLSQHTEQLLQFINKNGLEPISAAIYAFYNPPWTLPFLRRNEIMIEVKK